MNELVTKKKARSWFVAGINTEIFVAGKLIFDFFLCNFFLIFFLLLILDNFQKKKILTRHVPARRLHWLAHQKFYWKREENFPRNIFVF